MPSRYTSRRMCPGTLWRNHDDIVLVARIDDAVVDVKTVREHQYVTGFEVWLDGFAINLTLQMVRDKHDDDVGSLVQPRRWSLP